MLAKAWCQPKSWLLTHRLREQARSHTGFSFCQYLPPPQQQSHHQTKPGGNRHGLPWMSADVGFSGLDRGQGPVSRAGHRIPGLLELQGDLSAKGLRFLTDQ